MRARLTSDREGQPIFWQAIEGRAVVNVTQWFEPGHYAGWHKLLARPVTGRWGLWPWRSRFWLGERLLAAFVAGPEHADDSCLFLPAHKA